MENLKIEIWHVVIGSILRYLFFAYMAYVIFYIWKRKKWLHRKIQSHFPGMRSIRTELTYSASTTLIFSIVIYLVLFSPIREYTFVYSDVHAYPLAYLPISLVLIILVHDTYFYWIHRFMHLKKVFPYVHRIHHRSHNPTPFAAFSFHPLEALLEVGILPLVVFTMPVHNLVLAVFGVYVVAMNVIGHLGFELLPARFRHSKLFKLFSTSTHHNMHHHYGKGNFGFYFNIWDRVMKTTHPHYETEFREITERTRVLPPGSRRATPP